MGKFSSFKKQQVITESFRKFLSEGLDQVGGGSYDSSGKWQGRQINRSALDHEEIESNRKDREMEDDWEYDRKKRREKEAYSLGREIFHADPEMVYEKGIENMEPFKYLTWEQLQRLNLSLERKTGVQDPLKHHMNHWVEEKAEEKRKSSGSKLNPFNWFD